MKAEDAIQEYQCSGCVNGPYPDCFEQHPEGLQCRKHSPGTMIMPGIGKLFLGLPKGFNRLGPHENMKLWIFDSFDNSSWQPYDKFNTSVWKFFDEFKSTLVRGLSPRVNSPWLHIFLEDCRDRFDCYEVTKEDLDNMD